MLIHPTLDEVIDANPVQAILSIIELAHHTSHRISGLGWGDLPRHFSTKSGGKTPT